MDEQEYVSQIAIGVVKEIVFKVLSQLPYSPDLAHSNDHLFPKLKKHLHGKRYIEEKVFMDVVLPVQKNLSNHTKAQSYQSIDRPILDYASPAILTHKPTSTSQKLSSAALLDT